LLSLPSFSQLIKYFCLLCQTLPSAFGGLQFLGWTLPFMWGVNTRWFKYDRDDLCVNKSQFVPVIFEPPCSSIGLVVNVWTAVLRNSVSVIDRSKTLFVGWDGVIGIYTRYWLDGPWGVGIFRTRPDRPWGTPSLLYIG
jgi:hypothetical protein